MNSETDEPLASELRAAEAELEKALEEACATKPATEADTGDLIRVDELLGDATDAAKRAISLRRRRRVDKAKRAEQAPKRTARAVLADVEAAASPGASHRVFVDARGGRWDVFAVHPEARLSPHSQLKGTYPQGWLCFDSGTEKRRLSPIPDDWQGMSDDQLAGLAERAERATRGRKRPSKPPDESAESGSE